MRWKCVPKEKEATASDKSSMISCDLEGVSLAFESAYHGFISPWPLMAKEKEKIGKVNRPQGQWLTFPFPFLFLLSPSAEAEGERGQEKTEDYQPWKQVL